jgi:cysteine desulfurase
MQRPVYLDYNATTPIDKEVAKAMLPYIETNYGNPSSSYLMGRLNKEAIEKSRSQVASLIRCQPDEIFFTSGGTESNNHAILGVAFPDKKQRKHIITSSIEHPAVTEVCKYLSKQEFEITYLPVDKYGTVQVNDVKNAVQPNTVLITIMHANNETGTIQPIKEIASIAKANNILFHTDAAQSVGKIETDVHKLGIDLLSIAGHKLYAPKGVGALFIKQGTKIENLLYGAGQENNMRAGTENVIHIVGLGKACEIAQRDIGKNYRNMYQTRGRLLEGLLFKSNKSITVNTNLDNSLPNTLSIAFEKVDAHTLTSLIGNDVLISTGSACHSGITEISPVLKAMNINLRTAASTVRISTGKYTTDEEVNYAIEIISSAVHKLS